MDINTGRIVADINSVPESDRSRYTPIPPHLVDEAARELDGRDSVIINPKRAAALAEWANKKRKKNRARAKLAKASRRRNTK